MDRPNMVDQGITDYLRRLADRFDEPVLLEIEAEAAATGFPIVDRLCGVVCEMQARAVAAKRVFELGSGFGYSAYWFARATGADGDIHLTDNDPANATKAETYLAAVWDRITFHVGDALESFASVDGEFDVVFCDIDKESYPQAWRVASDRIRVGGLWICDNTLASGAFIITGQGDEDTRAAVHAHNVAVAADERYISTIVPTREGLCVALRIA